MNYNQTRMVGAKEKVQAKIDVANEVFDDIKFKLLNVIVQELIKEFEDGKDEPYCCLYDTDIIKTMLESIVKLNPEMSFKESYAYEVGGRFIEDSTLGRNYSYMAFSRSYVEDWITDTGGEVVKKAYIDPNDVIDFNHLNRRLLDFFTSFGLKAEHRRSRWDDSSGYLHRYRIRRCNMEILAKKVDFYAEHGKHRLDQYEEAVGDIKHLPVFMAMVFLVLGFFFILR